MDTRALPQYHPFKPPPHRAVRSLQTTHNNQVGEGKSGMLFFSSADREFIVKTVTPNELKFLERELKSYYDYMAVNGATSLLPRFVGLYFLKLPNKVRSCCMVWCTLRLSPSDLRPLHPTLPPFFSPSCG